MPFPFLPAGAVLAASVLIGALTIFGLILRAMDRAIIGIRDSAVSVLVAGMRTWGNGRSERIVTASPGATGSSPRGGREPRAPVLPDAVAASRPDPAPDPQPEIVELTDRRIEATAGRR
jgi:hypothetical protein